MNKKLEYHKEYPEAVYNNRVYRWFTDRIGDMSDSELQKFVNLCMRGNLTFQCADEIDIDDPDISMIDHLLMDIASQKNDELINTYTDEIDWDNDYVEKYNKDNRMDKKLEDRVSRLEKLLRKNEALGADNEYANMVWKTANDVHSRIQSMFTNLISASADMEDSDVREVANALYACKDDFPDNWSSRVESLIKRLERR